MAKKRINIYSTNPDWEYDDEQNGTEATLDPDLQNLRVQLDRKKRKGKEVTLITQFKGTNEDLKDLCKTLQKFVGSGGSAKDGEIILQGNHVKKINDKLIELGYTRTKISGGF